MSVLIRSLMCVAFLSAACAPVGTGPSAPGSSAPQSVEAPQAPKTLVVAAASAVRAFGDWSDSKSGGGLTLAGVHTNSLVSNDVKGYIPRLAEKLPSFDDHTLVVLADGRLQTTWRLRPNIKWHDGTPFSASDLVFTGEVYANPDVPLARTPHVTQMDTLEAPDPQTLVITFKTTYFLWSHLGFSEFWPLPRHVLGEPFQGDKERFRNLPYWTTEYVHLGAFRLVDWGLAENMLFERFDDYYLGRPKISTLVVRAIGDQNALLASVQSGAVDILTENAVPEDLTVVLREDWKRTGEGTVLSRQANLPYILIQFNPEYARVPDLGRDPRLRRGLFYGLDRDSLREASLPGFPDTEADSYVPKSDPRAAIVGRPYARYRYDPARALQELADAGWRRRADGRMLNAAGQVVQLPMRASQNDDRELAIIAHNWRELGLEVTEEISTPATSRDLEYQAKFPGLERTARGIGATIFLRLDSRLHPTPQNRYTGTATTGYVNPTLDRLIDRLYATIDESQQGQLLKELGEILADDLPLMPLYFAVKMAATRKGVRALTDDYDGADGPGLVAANPHLWDRD